MPLRLRDWAHNFRVTALGCGGEHLPPPLLSGCVFDVFVCLFMLWIIRRYLFIPSIIIFRETNL